MNDSVQVVPNTGRNALLAGFIISFTGAILFSTKAILVKLAFRDFIGLQYISAGLERLILFLYPSFAVLINAMLFHQRISRIQFWSLALTYTGIGIAYFGELKIDTGNPNLWEYGVALALVATVIPSFMLSAGMRRIGANNAAIVTSVGPVSTILQAHFFLGDRIFAEQVIGTALVIVGVLLIGWKERRLGAE